MIDDAFPTGAGTVHRVHCAENVLYEHGAGGVAVGIARTGVPADAAEEALQLRARMVETSRAAPSVGACVNRLVAALANHPAEFSGDEIECAIPCHGHEPISAA